MAKRIYKTMQGKIIDMESLMSNNETMPAVGNARMNARGDELGPGGKIIRTKEELVSEYYEDNPNSIPKEIDKKNKKSNDIKEVSKKIKETVPTVKEITLTKSSYNTNSNKDNAEEKEDKKKV